MHHRAQRFHCDLIGDQLNPNAMHTQLENQFSFRINFYNIIPGDAKPVKWCFGLALAYALPHWGLGHMKNMANSNSVWEIDFLFCCCLLLHGFVSPFTCSCNIFEHKMNAIQPVKHEIRFSEPFLTIFPPLSSRIVQRTRIGEFLVLWKLCGFSSLSFRCFGEMALLKVLAHS